MSVKVKIGTNQIEGWSMKETQQSLPILLLPQCARTPTHPHAHTHTRTHAHTHARAHSPTRTHTRAQAHACPHAQTHTRTIFCALNAKERHFFLSLRLFLWLFFTHSFEIFLSYFYLLSYSFVFLFLFHLSFIFCLHSLILDVFIEERSS